jgi:tetratricopeptide (TPR) repeat protein
MRHAVVVAPPHFELPAAASVFAAPEPVGPMCAALTRGGRRVMLVRATPDLGGDFVHAVSEVGDDDDLVVYIAAATTTGAGALRVRVVGADTDAAADESGWGIALDAGVAASPAPDRAVELGVLAEAVTARRPAAVLYLVEACHDGDGDDPMLAAEHVDVILRALGVRALGYGAAIGVRPASRVATEGGWPFTRFLLATLANPASRGEDGAASMSLVHERLRVGGAVEAHVQSFAFVRGQRDFVIVEAAARPSGMQAPPPEHAAAEPPVEAPVSEVPIRIADPASSPHEAPVDVATPVEVPISDIPISVGEPSRTPDDVGVEACAPAAAPSPAPPELVTETAAASTADATTAPPEEPRSASPTSTADTPRAPADLPAQAFADTAPPSSVPSDTSVEAPSPLLAEVMSDLSRPDAAPETRAPATSPDTDAAALPEPRPTEPSLPDTRPLVEPVAVDGAEVAAAPDAGEAAIPPPRATEPSLPAIEPLLDLADDALERGALPAALAGYKAALMVAPPGDGPGRALIYARIGALKRAQGKTREAELNFEKALHCDPAHQDALSALVELATESKEVRRVVDLRQNRLRTLTAPDERVAELRAIADIFSEQLGDPRGAADALDQALSVEGKSRGALQGLRTAYEKLRRWPRVAEVLVALAESADGAKERAALRCAAGEIALERLGDPARGFALLERALDDDPTLDKALRVLVAGRTAAGDWAAIEGLFERLGEGFAALGDTERAWDTWRKLGVLRRDKLQNAETAIEAFTNAVRTRPESVDSRALLAEMYLASGDEARAITQFERIAQVAPTRSSTYTRLFGLHRRAARTDQAWLAASVLVELGTADMDQQLFADQYRPDGPIRPTRSLDDAAWDDLLRAPGADDVVADVLRAIVATAVSTRVEELRQARQLLVLDPARRQSAASTVSVVRSFHWAAQVLGLDTPDLYVMGDVPGGIAAVQAAAPTTALGPDVLRGLTTKDLAFVAGRHLTYFRPEHYCLVHYPTLTDLSVLFLGAVTLVLADLSPPANLQEAVVRKRRALARSASDEERRRLGAAVERLEARDGRVDLGAWIRNVELTAQRAGLLLCGDLAVSTARLRAEADTRAIAELTFEEKRGDLLAFCASQKLSQARALLGVNAHASIAPPGGELQTA